ncbi:formate/nitrite transporter family protein [Raineyella fluvialis]|uniref:Formate/nitrite transporter family protein n=1 Tax=Raineyella fluvialis TaxID=2662261 RepID=A0A5Q2FDQ3_9ACTN|nr:formate/nitrite transporter family protein [Raineyella fluvialis]QGF22845.1 formate/nitrite transporter family protein [Raineyella fluvialis]
MSFNTPAEITRLAVASGETKANASPPKALVAGFLAGAYIAFGGLLATVTSAGLDPKSWGGLITLVTGVTFSLGLILVVIAGADLLTGNMMLVPLAVLSRRVTLAKLALNWLWVTIGNLVGSVFVAWLLADQTGLFAKGSINFARLAAIATGKAITESHWEQFVRAIGCNWLVCLAVWIALAATSTGGKILAIVPPITAFVALGFDHVVANMFFLPAAMMVGAGDLSLADTTLNLVFAYLGNAVGAGVFVAGAYFYLYGDTQGQPGAAAGAPAVDERRNAPHDR